MKHNYLAKVVSIAVFLQTRVKISILHNNYTTQEIIRSSQEIGSWYNITAAMVCTIKWTMVPDDRKQHRNISFIHSVILSYLIKLFYHIHRKVFIKQYQRIWCYFVYFITVILSDNAPSSKLQKKLKINNNKFKKGDKNVHALV